MQTQSTLSGKYQTVVPAAIRQKVHLRAGDVILWRVIQAGDQTVALAQPQPRRWAAHTRGLGARLWNNIDIAEYIDNLRSEWKQQR